MDPSRSEAYGKEALALATNLSYTIGSAFANRVIGVSHWTRGDYEDALKYLFDYLKK